MRPKRFFLPALFLFVLGAGNIVVGTYKEWQYTQVYDELSLLEASAESGIVSGLDRLRDVRTGQDNSPQNQYAQSQREARTRLQFYRLVAFGGKSFIALGVLLLAAALAFHLSGTSSQLRRLINVPLSLYQLGVLIGDQVRGRFV